MKSKFDRVGFNDWIGIMQDESYLIVCFDIKIQYFYQNG